VEYIQASRVRTLLMEDMARILSNIDVYLAPISASRGPAAAPGSPAGSGPPSGSGTRGPASLVNLNTTLTNVTGHPGIVVRNGFAADGRPTSITFIGNIYGEAGMLALAHAYQCATEWHLKHPSLA
jgi:Asp-tRNA(Asn)/Glu-tRNA(Gln) amidotransferase A subunit family amidase